MIRIVAFKDGRPVRNIPARSLGSLLKGKNVVWVDVERGSRKDFDFLQRTFNMHPLTIEDMAKSNSLPKIDIVNRSYMFVIFHELYYDKQVKKIKMNEINFCIGRNFLITVHIPAMKSVEDVRKKLMSKIYAGITADQIMHKIMDAEVDGYNRLMDELDDEIEDLEDRLLKGKSSHVLHILSDHRREVAQLRKIVGPQRDMLNKLSREDTGFISPKMRFYFRDIYDHVFRFYNGLEAHRDMISSAFETYTSIQSNNINKVVKQLSIISTVFLPLSFIVGVYGMNFENMPELQHEMGYYAVLGLVAAVGTSMFVYFKRKYG